MYIYIYTHIIFIDTYLSYSLTCCFHMWNFPMHLFKWSDSGNDVQVAREAGETRPAAQGDDPWSHLGRGHEVSIFLRYPPEV